MGKRNDLITDLQPSYDKVKYSNLLYGRACFTGKYTTREIHTKLHPGGSDVFSISLRVRISMTLSCAIQLYHVMLKQ